MVKKASAFGNNVLVGLIEKPKTTKQGIILPDAATKERGKVRVGKVLHVGPQANSTKTENGWIEKPTDMRLKAGDTVLIGHYAGYEVSIEDGDEERDCVILSADDILGLAEV